MRVYMDKLLPVLLGWECEFPHPPFPGSLDSPQPDDPSNDLTQGAGPLSIDESVGPLLRVHIAGPITCTGMGCFCSEMVQLLQYILLHTRDG